MAKYAASKLRFCRKFWFALQNPIDWRHICKMYKCSLQNVYKNDLQENNEREVANV